MEYFNELTENEHWKSLLDKIIAETEIGRKYKNSPNRWNGKSSEMFDLVPSVYPFLNLQQEISRHLLNDSFAEDHLYHCYLTTREISKSKRLKPGEKEALNLAALTHDLQEAFTGDKVSGTKTLDFRIYEMLTYRYAVLPQVIELLPNLESLMLRAFNILLADEHFRQGENIPDFIREAQTEDNIKLHKLYQKGHLLTFFGAVISAKENATKAGSPKGMDGIYEEVIKSKRLELLKLSGNPAIRKFKIKNKLGSN